MARAASSTVLPALVSVMNKVGSAALTNCRHWSTLRGPQYRQSQRLQRARTTSPVSWLMKTCRNAQGLGQKSSVSKPCFSAKLAWSSREGRIKREELSNTPSPLPLLLDLETQIVTESIETRFICRVELNNMIHSLTDNESLYLVEEGQTDRGNE